MLRASDSDDLKVEVLGILGNVSIPDLDYAKVVKDLALLTTASRLPQGRAVS